MDFPTWFSLGCYGGLACCMCAIAINALYTTLRKRGTTRQLAGAIVICVVSALLLLPAIVWYNLRFAAQQIPISTTEVALLLVHVSLFGWLLPFGITLVYCLFTLPRTSTTAVHIPRQKRTTRADPAVPSLTLPKYQPGEVAPFVFNEDTPWGWLEHRGGRFQGQRLELKRKVVTIGRGEENDIWLDDDMASRNHAELIWDQGRVYVRDCDSLNGVSLAGRRIREVAVLGPGELLEVGSHRFLFELANAPAVGDRDDPLLLHAPRISLGHASNDVTALPVTPPLGTEATPDFAGIIPDGALEQGMWQETAKVGQVATPAQPGETSAFVVRNGPFEGRSFLLERPVLTVGRGPESDVVINDPSISRRHAQLVRQPNGDYVQDLASRNGTTVNAESLLAPRLLRQGDIVCLGNICMEYIAVATSRSIPSSSLMPPLLRPTSGPMPLRLPSRSIDA